MELVLLLKMFDHYFDMLRRSREREERSRASPNSLGGPSPRERGGLGPSPRERGGQGPSPRERGRSPGPRRNINRNEICLS